MVPDPKEIPRRATPPEREQRRDSGSRSEPSRHWIGPQSRAERDGVRVHLAGVQSSSFSKSRHGSFARMQSLRSNRVRRARVCVGANGARSYQPGATPQENRPSRMGALKARLNESRFQRRCPRCPWRSWGGAPGWYEEAPSARLNSCRLGSHPCRNSCNRN